MASKLTLRFGSRILHNFTNSIVFACHRNASTFTIVESPSILSSSLLNHRCPFFWDSPFAISGIRFFSTVGRRQPVRSKTVDIGARARQLQNRRLWTYALTFSCIAGFIVLVLNNFQDQLVFYVTPTDALEKFKSNPSKAKFRLGGLVLEGSVAQPASSLEMEFVITDLITDMLVRYQGSLPDLFREGHSVVVEGFVKPFTDDIRKEISKKSVSEKARSGDCYFSATEVLAKHDEKYMPGEVAAAIEKNKKTLADAAAANGEEKEEDRSKSS